MPTIAQAIADNNARKAGQTETVSDPVAPVPFTIAPTPPQDLPVGLGLPQRGMFSTSVASVADRNDNARVFRGQGVRSATFPGNQTQSNITTKVTTTNVSVTPTTSSSSGITTVINDTNILGSITGQNLTLGWSGQLSIARGGTGTSTPSLVAGTNVTITGSWPNQTISASGGSTGGGVVAQTSSYGAQNTDAGQLVSFNSASPVTYTLQNSGVSGSWFVYVENVGTGALTISPNGLTLDTSASSLTLSQNQGVVLFWDGSNYWTERGMGAGGVTITGSPVSGNLTKFSGSGSITNGDLSGDLTTSGTLVTTLATVNSNVGSFTNANIIVNAKGLITAAANGSVFTNPMTTEGDIIIENATPAPTRLPIGTSGQVLTVSSGLPAWINAGSTGGGANPKNRRWAYFAPAGGAPTSNTSTSMGDAFTTFGTSSNWVAAFGGSLGFKSPVWSYTSSSTSGATGNHGSLQFGFGANLYWAARVALNTSTNVRIRCGLTNNQATSFVNTDTPTAFFATFRYSTSAGDTNWMCETSNNNSAAINVINSGVPFVASTDFLLEIQCFDSVPNIVFSINGTVVGTSSTDIPSIPTTTPVGSMEEFILLSAGTQIMYLWWVYVESDN